MFEEEGEEEWVESEIERQLADLAHLTLQDLEEEDSGCHGSVEVWFVISLAVHKRLT